MLMKNKHNTWLNNLHFTYFIIFFLCKILLAAFFDFENQVGNFYDKQN